MNVLLFPGQGSQSIGMGLEFYKNFNYVKRIFEEADDKLKYSISKIILEGPENELQLTKNTQPAILTISYSIFKILSEEYGLNLKSYKYFAGHSLGEYSALVCSESLNFNDAVYLLHERERPCKKQFHLGKGSMIAILGLKTDEIQNLINNRENKKGICEIANDNANGQVIVSGDKKNVEDFKIQIKEKNIKTIPLKVSAPFHCSLMRPAAEKMKEKINKTNFKSPKINIINNVTAKPENDAGKIKKLLIDQIYSTVRWRESILNMHKEGIKNFVEIGPGKVLTSMVKRTVKEAKCFSINSIADIKNLNDKF